VSGAPIVFDNFYQRSPSIVQKTSAGKGKKGIGRKAAQKPNIVVNHGLLLGHLE